MSYQNRIRLVGTIIFGIKLLCWVYPSYGVFSDYIALLNQESIVQISVTTLWIPIGFFGVLLTSLWTTPSILFYGKKVNEMYSPKAIQAASKLCIYFAIAGVIFAIGWTYHSLNLLDKYGYEYSDNLTKITPTGIHLVYVKSKN